MRVELSDHAFDRALEAGTKITAVAAKDGAEQLGLVGDAYQVVDLFAAWQLSEDASANLTLSNIFDRRYTQYHNGSPSPGFDAKFSFTTRFGG